MLSQYKTSEIQRFGENGKVNLEFYNDQKDIKILNDLLTKKIPEYFYNEQNRYLNILLRYFLAQTHLKSISVYQRRFDFNSESDHPMLKEKDYQAIFSSSAIDTLKSCKFNHVNLEKIIPNLLPHLKNSTLESITIHNCNLTLTEIKHLRLLKKSVTALTTLDLSFNQFDKNKARILRKALKVLPLKELILIDCALGDAEIACLAPAFKNNTLKKLDLSRNNFKEKGVTALSEVLKESNLEKMYLGGNAFKDAELLPLLTRLRGSNLKELILKNIEMGSEGLKNLADSLKETNITSLDITRNWDFRREELNYFFKALKKTAIQKLLLRDCGVKHNSIYELSALLRVGQIKYLDISHNKDIGILSTLVFIRDMIWNLVHPELQIRIEGSKPLELDAAHLYMQRQNKVSYPYLKPNQQVVFKKSDKVNWNEFPEWLSFNRYKTFLRALQDKEELTDLLSMLHCPPQLIELGTKCEKSSINSKDCNSEPVAIELMLPKQPNVNNSVESYVENIMCPQKTSNKKCSEANIKRKSSIDAQEKALSAKKRKNSQYSECAEDVLKSLLSSVEPGQKDTTMNSIGAVQENVQKKTEAAPLPNLRKLYLFKPRHISPCNEEVSHSTPEKNSFTKKA